jgi:hypothetical protein
MNDLKFKDFMVIESGFVDPTPTTDYWSDEDKPKNVSYNSFEEWKKAKFLTHPELRNTTDLALQIQYYFDTSKANQKPTKKVAVTVKNNSGGMK